MESVNLKSDQQNLLKLNNREEKTETQEQDLRDLWGENTSANVRASEFQKDKMESGRLRMYQRKLLKTSQIRQKS